MGWSRVGEGRAGWQGGAELGGAGWGGVGQGGVGAGATGRCRAGWNVMCFSCFRLEISEEEAARLWVDRVFAGPDQRKAHMQTYMVSSVGWRAVVRSWAEGCG